jgi:hypothetical protein
MASGTFDFDAFAQTAIDATKVDYEFKAVPDKTESAAQITALSGRSMEEYRDSFQGRHCMSVEVTWSLNDPNLKKELNMDKIEVRQGIIVDLTGVAGEPGTTIDWSTNRSQGLKDLMLAVGLNNDKGFNFNKLKHQEGWVITKMRDATDGSGRKFSEVARVMNLAKGREAHKAKNGSA